MEPHLNYTNPVLHLLRNYTEIKGMAHITGGGFLENIPRILPQGCGVEIKQNSWEIPPVFFIMEQLGALREQDLFSTFNMGIGLVLILNENLVDSVRQQLLLFPEFSLYEIGRVVSSEKKEVRIV